MFGYVRPYQEELLVRQAGVYRAYYCGVCKGLGKQCGPVCRMFLQFDFALLALALDEALAQGAQIDVTPCSVNPLRRLSAAQGEALRYSADAHGILLHGKALDGAHDKQAWGLLRPITGAMTRHANARQPDISQAMLQMLSEQRLTENAANPASPDAAAEPFARFCGVMFSPALLPDKHRELYRWLGYNLGKWIYFIDALDDLESDRKKGAYNPWHGYATREEAASFALPVLHACAEQALAAWDLMPERRHHAIVRNILDLGLFDMAQRVVKKEPQKTLTHQYEAGR